MRKQSLKAILQSLTELLLLNVHFFNAVFQKINFLICLLAERILGRIRQALRLVVVDIFYRNAQIFEYFK